MPCTYGRAWAATSSMPVSMPSRPRMGSTPNAPGHTKHGRPGLFACPTQRGGPAVIVVVDDEPDVLAVICALLEEEGHQVLCLGHPVHATALRGAKQLPDLFLIDIMLPDMNG